MTDEIADTLDELAEYLRLDGQSGQARMYFRAADNIRTTDHIPADPSSIDGIGESLREDVAEVQHTGTLVRLQKLKEEYPYHEAFRQINGIGPVTSRRLGEAGITTKQELRGSINSGNILKVDGVGKKTAEKIKQNL